MPTRSRLITTVFRPDVWFVMPPACNVVFPEECTSVSYSRQMMRETTRLELQTFTTLLTDSAASGASAELIQQYYFAPALIDDSGLPTLPDRLGNNRKEDGTLNPAPSEETPLTDVMYTHEKFTGIIPKIERIADTAFYAALEANADAGTGVTATDIPTVRQYAQRVALFNFLRNRYLARQASISGVFMPRLVAGFPALIVNRPKESDTDDPTHFIGMIANVSHTLNQDGGTTSLALAYARPHTIASEEESFLKFLAATTEDIPAIDKTFTYGVNTEGTEEVNRINERLRTISASLLRQGRDPVAELYIPFSQGNFYGPDTFDSILIPAGLRPSVFSATIVFFVNQGDDLATPVTTEILFSKQPSDPTARKAYRAYINAVDTAEGEETAEAYATRKGLPSVQAPISEFTAPDGNTYPIVLSYYIKQDAQTKEKSFEEIMTPPWFSDAYANANISTYYRRLLGCASMGDQFGDSSSVENAARKTVASYSVQPNVEQNAGDPEFVYLNTKREIPTQSQVLEFHRFAFADGASPPLFGLDPSGGGVKEANTGPIARNRTNTSEELVLAGSGDLDPRQERRFAVKLYQDQLLGRRAFRG